MDLRTLEYFLAIAEEQNMTRAAEKLMTTQSNLSHQIKKFEKELGCTLFIRTKKMIALTEEGLYLRKQAQEILSISDKTRNTLMNFDSDTEGEVRLGGAETSAIHLVGAAIKNIRQTHPGISFVMDSGADYDIYNQLDHGALDFALVVPPIDKEKYNWILMPVQDELGFIVPEDHPLAKRRRIRPADLKDYPVQIGGDALKRQGAGTVWAEAADSLNVSVNFNLVTNSALMAEDGVGISITVRGLFHEPADHSMTFKPLSPGLKMNIYLIWQKFQMMSRPSRLFLNELNRGIKNDGFL